MEKQYKQAFEIIKKANNILLITHYRPDGDALGSLCAMIEFVESLGKNYTAWCADVPPEQFSFLPNLEKIKSGKASLDFDKQDLIITIDCGSTARTKIEKQLIKRGGNQFYLEFDHHPKSDDYSDLEIRQPELSSSAEVLFNFFKTNKQPINKRIANCLLTGIMTDTGNLLYPSTTNETVKIASDLLRLGARFPDILENTWRNKSLEAMKIWGQAMNNLVVNKKYKIAITALTLEDIQKSGASEEEFEGISGFLSNTSGANALLFLREERKGEVRGSLRGIHPKIDISKLAKILGGGGHPKASGFFLPGSIVKNGESWKII